MKGLVRIKDIELFNDGGKIKVEFVSGHIELIEAKKLKTGAGFTTNEAIIEYLKPSFLRAFLCRWIGVNNQALNISEIADYLKKSRKYVRARLDDFDFTLSEIEDLYLKYADEKIKDFLNKYGMSY